MRINSASAYTAVQSMAQTSATRDQHQVAVLKKALDSQKSSADQLLKMLEPKGKIVDIRA